MVDRLRAGVAHVALVCDGAVVASGPIGADGACQLELVDGLLRLDLLACRVGWSVHLSDVADDLREVLDLVGVADHFVE